MSTEERTVTNVNELNATANEVNNESQESQETGATVVEQNAAADEPKNAAKESKKSKKDAAADDAKKKTKEPKKGGSKWKSFTAGSFTGMAMGAGGAFAGLEVVNAAEDSSANVAVPVNGGAETETVSVATENVTGQQSQLSAEDQNSEVTFETPAEPVVVNVSVATSVNDDMTFNQAFAAARSEVGAAGVFEWHGKTYNTFYAEEWDAMSPAERDAFYTAAAGAEREELAVVDVVSEDTTDGEVRVIGVYEDNIEGQDVYVGEVEVDGGNVMFVDVDHDGTFDYAIADVDGNGEIDENEYTEISSVGISVEDFVGDQTMPGSDDLLAANDMPDYMNDADVSMC